MQSRLARAVGRNSRQAGGVEQQRRSMQRERRLGTLVVVGRLRAEPVTTASGREIVERPVEAVVTEEPIERGLCTHGVLRVAGSRERGQLRRDDRGGVEGLLVPTARRGFTPPATSVAGQAQHSLGKARLVSEPPQRLQARRRQIRSAERHPAADQGVREARVVVAERILEPAPLRRGMRLERRRQFVPDPLEQPQPRRRPPVRIQTRQSERGVGARPQRYVSPERADDCVEQASGRPDDSGYPGGGRGCRRAPTRSGRRDHRDADRRASGDRIP